jgi:lipoprotein-anchoring transpeptidase ErfK/SrfK
MIDVVRGQRSSDRSAARRDRATARDHAAAADEGSAIPARFKRQIVSYQTSEAPGTIVIDTPHTRLFYVLGGGGRERDFGPVDRSKISRMFRNSEFIRRNSCR